MATKTATRKTTKVCAGYYRVRDGLDTVIVEQVDPNKAYGDTRPMWMAAAQWTSTLYSDPVATKREAMIIANSMLDKR